MFNGTGSLSLSPLSSLPPSPFSSLPPPSSSLSPPPIASSYVRFLEVEEEEEEEEGGRACDIRSKIALNSISFKIVTPGSEKIERENIVVGGGMASK